MKRVPVTGAEDVIGTRFPCCVDHEHSLLAHYPVDEFWLAGLRDPSNARVTVA